MVTHELTEKDGKHVCNCGSTYSTVKGARSHLENPSGRHYETHKSSKWKLNRIIAKIRDGFRCVDCGLTNEEHLQRDDLFGGGLHVHHKIPTREFGRPEESHALWNLVTVCAKCHQKRDRNNC